MRIIGVTGKKYSGKDTIGDYLVQHYGYKKIAFADALKNICQTLFDFTDDQLNTNLKDQTDERWGRSPREILQFVGTELVREKLGEFVPSIGDSVWVDIVRRRITSTPTKYVITDVRFENEMEMVKEMGGVIFLVKRDQTHTDDHISEQTIDKLEQLLGPDDCVIYNEGPRESLYQMVRMLME